MLFRRTDKYGYSRYYGNGGPALIAKIIITILAVVVIVLGGATIGLQKYMVYTENGGHLELPWHFPTSSHQSDEGDKAPAADTSEEQKEDTKTEEPQKEDAVPVVDDTPKKEDEQADASAPVEPAAPVGEPLVGDLLVEHVSIGDVTGGHAPGTVRDAKANGIMLFLKESGGALNYSSKLEMSERLDASVGSEKGKSINKVIQQMKSDGIYALAYLNGFDDGRLSEQSGFALTDSNGREVKNERDIGWVDPANKEAQKYLVDVVTEIAELGYDEIVLYEACYPYGSGAESVDGAEDTITAFYAELAKVAKAKKVMVSVVADANVILGKDSTSGQTLDSLKALGGHVWVMADQADDADALSEALKNAGFPDNTLGIVDGQLKKGTGHNYLNQD